MTVFYRKYRPQKLSEIIGQESIVKTILAQLQSGRISHGYLFAGPKGTGKTSTARILAKAVNCQRVQGSKLTVHSKSKSVNREPLTVSRFAEPCCKCDSCLAIANGSCLDLIEIDAASNRGIDEIRDLREKIKLSPVSSKFKVYIIDEAHMLTNEAFNALLKTLEEPPSHAIFILCTTEPSRLPVTILSRLSRFNFIRANEKALLDVISVIAQKERIKIEKEAIAEIIKAADGSFRDAVSLLDQLSAHGKVISKNDIKQVVASSGQSQLIEFIENLRQNNAKELVLEIDKMQNFGADLSIFAKDLVLLLEKLLMIKLGAINKEDFAQDLGYFQQLERFAANLSFDALQKLMKLFLVAENEIKIYPLSAIPLVLAVCQYCQLEENVADSPYIEKETEQEESKLKVSKKNLPKLAAIEAKWTKLLEKVKPYNSHVSALLKATKPVDFDGRKLTVEVFYRFHKDKLQEPKIIKMLEEIISELVGVTIHFNFVLAQSSAKAPRVVEVSDVVEIDQGELEKISQELFSK